MEGLLDAKDTLKKGGGYRTSRGGFQIPRAFLKKFGKVNNLQDFLKIRSFKKMRKFKDFNRIILEGVFKYLVRI